MRVESISCVYYSKKQNPNVSKCKPLQQSEQNVSFKKNTCAKGLAAIFGTFATAGALIGTTIMTGGAVLPLVLGYGALGAGSGAVIGHMLDQDPKDDKGNKSK